MAKTRRSMGSRKRKEQNKKYMENKRSIVRNSSQQKPSELNQDANQTPLVSSVSEASQNAKDLSTSSSKVGVTPQDLNPDTNQTPLIPSVSETSRMGKDSTPPSDAAAETNSILPENILHDYALHDLDPKEVLTGELSVQMMDYVSQLFKEQFKITDGMLPPSYMYGLECSKDKKPSFKFNMNKHIVQIHFINDPIRHFVVSSQENCHLVIYDSLFNIGRINDLKAQMNILYDNLDERNVKYVVPQSQGSTNLCGFFAIANAYMLLSRTEPGYRQYITSKMRQHLEQCIQKREITSFPSSVTFKRKRSMDPEHDTAQNKKQKICPMECKRQSRQNIELSNKGKSRDNACKQDARKTAEFREKERTRNRERKMRQRQNVEYKQKETEYDRQQKVKKRQNVECKQKETEYNRQLKIKHRQNVDFSQKETEYDRQQKVKKRQNVECKQKETEYNRQLKVKQRQNVEFSQKETEYDRQQKVKKRQNVECKQKETEYNRQLKVKQRQNVEFSQKETEYDRQQKVKKRQNVECKQKETEYNRQLKVKQRQNVDFSQKETEYDRQQKVKKRQNVECKQKETEYNRQLKVKKRQNVELSQKETEYNRQLKVKQRQNVEFKQKETECDRQQKVKQRQNVEFKKKEKELKICERQNHQFKQKERSQQKHKKQLCRKDEEFRKTENLKNKQKKSQNKLQHRQTISIIENCIKEFREECSKIPCSICSVCYKYLFRKQVVKLVLAKYPDEQQVLDCIAKNNFHQEKTTCLPDCKNCAKWICVTCQRHLSKGTIPNQAAINNLALDEQPECLRKLNQLERHLISPVIPFMKILNLPKSLQKGIHGPVICVPSNIPNVTQTLPRTVSDHTIIKVKLKRKLEYRGHHLYQQVSLTNLQEALQELKDHNPHFTGINVNFDNFTEDEECSSLVNSIDTDIDDHVDQSKVLQPKNNQCGIDEEENSTIQPSICVTDKETDVLNTLDITGSSTIPSNDNKKEHEGGTENDLHETSSPMVSCLQPEDLAQHVSSFPDLISVAPAEGNKPDSVFEVETKCFPYLFVNGKNDFNQNRSVKLGIGRYFNSRLFSADLRFVNDPQYIFYSQFVSELKQINSSLSIAMRHSTPNSNVQRPVTAAMLTDATQRKQIINSNQGYRFLQNSRGSPAYWEKTLHDLFAMVRQLGTPNWFCSFSAADRRWPEIVTAICKQQGRDVPNDMDWTTYCSIINSNPVTACRMFESRVHAFISKVILSPAEPIGKIVDYFYRTEFQKRGWPHIHCIFWCENAPKFDEDDINNIEFINFIDKYISCSIPNEETEPELYEKVSNLQMHSKTHTATCKKGNRNCRFNFPRPPAPQTFIASPKLPPDNVSVHKFRTEAMALLQSVWDSLENSESMNLNSAQALLNHLHLTQNKYQEAHCALTKRNTVIYKRDISECYVNPYNKHLLLAWNGNIDIQPILDPYSCIMYIVSYITKAEREMGDLLKRVQKEANEGHMEPLQQLRKLGNVYLNAREVCIMEAIYRVCGMKLKQCTREVVYVPTDPHSVRLTKPIHVLQNSEDDEDIYMTNITDRYLARPILPDFEQMSLADFVSQYKVLETSNKEIDTDQTATNEKIFILQKGLGTIRKRQKLAVIRYSKFSKEKKPEKYYQTLTKMYLPHRTDIKPDPTFQSVFERHSDLILSNMNQYEKLTSELDQAWQLMQEGHIAEEAWALIAPNQEEERVQEEEEFNHMQQFQQNSEEIPPDDIPDLLPFNNSTNNVSTSAIPNAIVCSSIDHANRLRTLNAKQAHIFYYIRQWAQLKKTEENTEPFKIFLTGGAGTGKSHVVKCVYNEMDKILTRHSGNAENPVVLLMAYTGTAAYNIGGQTIHSALGINKSMGKALGEDHANTLRCKYQDLQLIIIDEISMVSVHMLDLIHSRLQQIKQPFSQSATFGNISILAVGDFFQVPPVAAKSLTSNTTSLTDLWSLFHIWKLDEVVRQKDDLQFISLLNRLRVRKRTEPILPDDLSLLETRLISPDDSNYPSQALHIAATHAQLDIHNQRMLKKLGQENEMINIEAADICMDSKSQKSFKRNEPLAQENTSLPSYLAVCVNAKVMLTCNINVEDGLTNGAIGTVTSIIKGRQPLGQPEAIFVAFDDINIGFLSRQKHKPPSNLNPLSTLIKPHTDVIQQKPLQITRHQFPFILAWAVTIHKTQGITTSEAVISLNKIFKAGMAYVALSRVTSLNGLYLIKDDFKQESIYCDPSVEKAVNKMVKSSELPNWNLCNPLPTLTDQIVITSHNTEGFLPHVKDIKNNLFLLSSDIIALQETWLSKDFDIQTIFQNHSAVFHHRGKTYEKYSEVPQSLKSGNKGGVALFIHNDFDYHIIPTTDSGIECVAIHLHRPSMSIYNVYRPPDLKLNKFIESLCCVLQGEAQAAAQVIVGDFNVDLIKTKSVLNKPYEQHISMPTTSKQTLLDHIYSKNIDKKQAGVCPIHYSYHNMIFITV